MGAVPMNCRHKQKELKIQTRAGRPSSEDTPMMKGEHDQAIRELTLMPEDNGAPVVERYIVERAQVYTRLGKTREARSSLTELIQLSQRRKIDSWWFACAYAALGEKDRAFEWIEKAYRERPSEMISFAASPDMDVLRSDPRYQAMLRRMDIPER
jgi:tetratricopeptide (TPR) repeat protein